MEESMITRVLVTELDATLAMPYRLHEAVPQWELGYLYGVLKEILVGVGYNHTHRSWLQGAAVDGGWS